MWYNCLRPFSVSSFDQLVKESEHNFLASIRPKLFMAIVLGLSQKDNKSFSHFVAHFTTEIRAILDAHPFFIIQAFLMGLRSSKFFLSLIERSLTTITEMLQRANQYIIVEALVARKREEHKRPHTKKL
ncbi:hypothetical protein BHE74_00031221 [Ensete ventricosum]|uniref:Uncharacterized protein n=1 Tax=Ensete ventricosum TaxID=4639 RepID=A0A444CZP2_ENSVE|nr:hypothetical protein GW17_00046378 [Ensete ventricosum]RWW61706.1 hypothetical protein BHE74_00031221 [Ensete ventricosum]RZR73280.1 hypothetical protein BHM03_00022264 [Ensete ventricosum]